MPSTELVQALGRLGSYTQIPERLRREQPELGQLERADVFGIADRLAAIRVILRSRSPARIADLGGNTGTISLSLIDEGLASSATVYDLNTDALSAGKAIAAEMKLEDRITFVEQAVTLEALGRIKPVDVVLCLNLLHHAGAIFDKDLVQRDGWESYAERWLRSLRSKTRLAVVSVGFRDAKPPHWDAPRALRSLRFAQIARRAGWASLYAANVQDIHDLGVERANGRRTRTEIEARLRFAAARIRRGLRSRISKFDSKRDGYHLYILEQR